MLKKTSLGTLADYINGRGFKKTEWKESGIPIIRIQNLTESREKFNYFQGEVNEKNIVRKGDLLMSWAATLDVYFWDGPKAALNQHIFKVIPKINKKLLYYLLKTKISELYAKTHGTGMVHITSDRFKNLEVEIPESPEEQELVASEIETQLTRLEASTRSLKSLRDKLELYRKSVLKAAFEGRGVSAEFTKKKIKDVSLSLDYGTSEKAKDTGRIPVLRMGNIQKGRIIYDNLKFYDDISKMKELILEEGDLLFNRTNSPELVGKTSIFRPNPNFDDVVFASYLIRIRVNKDLILPAYLNYWLNSPQADCIKSALRSQQVGQANINGTKLKNIEFPFTDLPAQSNIVQAVEERLSLLDKIEETVSKSMLNAEKLKKSILKSAFEGKLVKGD